MQNEEALAALSALGHPRRLEALRLLVSSGAEGLLAGEVADRLGAKQNTMSTNLAVLLRARLVEARREGRGVRYTANIDTFSAMLQFLVSDCCGGNLAVCRALEQALKGDQMAEQMAKAG
ncbi:MAG: metalloregulator ArsR/SmtB family transcription factor [Pseudomonadota bacterium]